MDGVNFAGERKEGKKEEQKRNFLIKMERLERSSMLEDRQRHCT
jgi:hypothetical protein